MKLGGNPGFPLHLIHLMAGEGSCSPGFLWPGTVRSSGIPKLPHALDVQQSSQAALWCWGMLEVLPAILIIPQGITACCNPVRLWSQLAAPQASVGCKGSSEVPAPSRVYAGAGASSGASLHLQAERILHLWVSSIAPLVPACL